MRQFLSLRRLKLKQRMVLILGVIAILQTGTLGYFAINYLDRVLNEQIGQQAMRVAMTIAAMPDVVEAVSKENSTFLQPLSVALARSAQARFVVFGNEVGIRLAHPLPDRLGKSMADDDGDTNAPALIHGQAYIAQAEGSVGWSVRGKAPIFSPDGKSIIGIVSVGYLLDTVDAIVIHHTSTMFFAILAAFIFSVITAILFANHFRRAIFNLEPEQIARLFQERNVTLETVREGIVAINQSGYITTFNRAAIKTLALPEDQLYIGRHITDVLPDTGMETVLEEGEPDFDQEIWLHHHNLIVNRIPLRQNGLITGVVSSFRLKDEVDLVSRKLTRIKQYAESLRSQAHEYNNKLHTLAGLIHMGATNEALRMIGQETSGHQSFIQRVMQVTSDSILAGCLLGKYNRARELGLRLTVDKESHMQDLPEALPREQLVSILGNLVDNALEATLDHYGPDGQVTLSFSDYGKELIFEVNDQGAGLSHQQAEAIFTRGYTTKETDGHGIGLDLVQRQVAHLGGIVTVEPNMRDKQGRLSGSRFTVYIPRAKWQELDQHPYQDNT